jgi:hypothetical protein
MTMNPSKTWNDERPSAADRGKARTGLSLSNDEDMRQPHALWGLDEIEAPETWTLASFDDLLPHEMA